MPNKRNKYHTTTSKRDQIMDTYTKVGTAWLRHAAILLMLFTLVPALPAQEIMEETVAVSEPVLDSGNTAWILTSSLLVLLMSIPGIALFYGGLVRQKNVLSVIMQTLFIVGVVSILWIAFGYSWAFDTSFAESENPLACVIGGFDKAFLHGITLDTLTTGQIPEILFAMFQCMFAIITPALILGAFAERIKFSGYIVFIVLWTILAYFPMAHWVWGGGFLQEMGAIDFAGGTVVHINAGISALIMAIMLGKRTDYRIGHPITPHNVTFVFMGTSFLWLGWFGFNAGSGLCADGLAANAFMVTHIATATAAITWMVIDWTCNKKPTTIGACTGAVAGLVAITPAAGTVDLLGAFCIGIITPVICFFMVAVIKPKFKYDDALDAFGVHGIGGIVGSILTGLWIQIVATLVSIAFSAVITFILFKAVDSTIGLRVDKRVEEEGLDIYEHGESAYNH